MSWTREFLARTPKSKSHYEKASAVLPAGSARSTGAYNEPYPIYMKRAKGSRCWDLDGNSYIDYNLAGGCLILGHAHPSIIKAVRKHVGIGTMLMPSHPLEYAWAEKIRRHVPCAEMIRCTLSGSEACEYAFRLAKVHTQRPKLLKFEGAYHGQLVGDHFVSVRPPLDKAGPEDSPTPFADSPDLDFVSDIIRDTIVVPFNNEKALESALDKHGAEVAAVVVEPVLRANIAPREGFLRACEKLAHDQGALLVFDEVVTGFRLALGGAQEYWGVKPDLVVLGKSIAGGLPLGAFAGRREIMSHVLRRGDEMFVNHQGTHNAQPLSTAASIATMTELEKKSAYSKLEKYGERIRKSLRDAAEDNHVDCHVSGIASMWNPYFTTEEVHDYRAAARADRKKANDFKMNLVIRGVLPIIGSVRNVVSIVHTSEDLQRTSEVFQDSMKAVAEL